MVWKAVVYAQTEEAYHDAVVFLFEQFREQEALLTYITSQWLPWHKQFVSCWTSRIRNFGIRVTSRTESNHREIKGYLHNSSANLDHLAAKVELMITNRRNEYEKAESDEQVRQLNDYQTREWMGDTRSRCSRHALKLLLEQFWLAVAASKSQSPPTVCTGQFKLQYGIPCSHDIKAKEAAQTPLSYLDLHPHWHLGRDLVEEDRLRHILEPIVVLSSRGRPQLRPDEIPAALIPRGTNQRRQAAAARAREPSEWEIEEANARERQREVAARFEQQQQQQQRGRGQHRGQPHRRRLRGSGIRGAPRRGGQDRLATVAAPVPIVDCIVVAVPAGGAAGAGIGGTGSEGPAEGG